MPISYSSLKTPLVRFDDSLTDLTTVAPAGTQRYIEENNSLYISDGRGWYQISLINQTPTITTTVPAQYDLELEEDAITLTIEAEDAENAELVYSYTVDGDLVDTTIVAAGNVYTITPGATSTTVDVTWSVSDGTNIATAGPTTIVIALAASVQLDYTGTTVANVGDTNSTLTFVGATATVVEHQSTRSIQTNPNRTFTVTPYGIVHGDEFTLEYYYYLAGSTNGYWDIMLNIRGASDSTQYGRPYWQTGHQQWAVGSGSNWTYTSNILPQATWYHVVIMGSPTLGLKLYRDGTLISTPHDSDYVYGNAGDAINFEFGDANQYFADLRIVSGFEYDTAGGFTPPARTVV